MLWRFGVIEEILRVGAVSAPILIGLSILFNQAIPGNDQNASLENCPK